MRTRECGVFVCAQYATCLSSPPHFSYPHRSILKTRPNKIKKINKTNKTNKNSHNSLRSHAAFPASWTRKTMTTSGSQ